MNNPEIRIVKNKHIDRAKWDQCVSSSANSLIYIQSWYLDITAPNWDALIWGDYTFVMPLIIKRKYGISYLTQPIFAQQHGIFPKAEPTIQNIFLKYIRDKFKFITINLNSSHSEPFPDGFEVSIRNNFILNLSSSYDKLILNYSEYTRRKILKAEINKISVIKGLPSNEYLDLKNLVAMTKIPETSMQTLNRLINYGYSHGNGTIYAAYSQDNKLCAAALFLFSGQRAIYLNAASTAEGKDQSAMFQIIDQFIQEHAGTPLILDFEGSSIRGIANFYKGFSTEFEQYYCLKSNRLPIPFRWFKK